MRLFVCSHISETTYLNFTQFCILPAVAENIDTDIEVFDSCVRVELSSVNFWSSAASRNAALDSGQTLLDVLHRSNAGKHQR